MFFNASINKIYTFLLSVFSLALCFVVIIFSKECAKGAVNGIELCLRVLVPSLFPFMAISSFIVKSGIADILGKPFEKPMKKIFGLSGCFAPVFLLGLIGGYPVGAKGIFALKEKGNFTEQECEKASLFLVCGGPGFMVNFVGMSIYNNKKIGLILLLSQISSVIILGIVNNILSNNEKRNFKNIKRINKFNSNQKNIKNSQKNKISFSDSIVYSVYEASKGILSICSFVVLFSAVVEILNSFISNIFIKNIILCTLEVCNAVNSLSKTSNLVFIAFALGFGGICVHFQVFSALGNIKVNLYKFFIYRIFGGILSASFTFINLKIFAGTTSVFSTAKATNPTIYGGSILSGLALVILSICFLFSIKSIKNN